MDRLLRLFAAGVVVVVVLIIAVKLMMSRHENSPTVTVSAPAPTPAQTTPSAPDDPCGQAVILSVRSHSGAIAQMSLQNLDGQDLEANKGTDAEGQFTTECAKVDDDTSSDGSPGQVLQMCKPGTFVVHITGSGKGLFDFQAKALPDVAHPISPLLLCNYAIDNDRVYDWVLKYQGGSKPAVFLLGSKGDANAQPQ